MASTKTERTGRAPFDAPIGTWMYGIVATLLLVLTGAGLLPAAHAQSDGPATRWFETENLNAGLSDPKYDVDRETPRSALESFIDLSQEGRFDDAAQILDLTALPVSSQPEVGPQLAERLFQVIDRKIWLDWTALPDRPDGLVTTGSGDAPRAGEPRRDYSLGMLNLEGRPVSIRLRRMKPADGDPAWVFSQQTVDNIPGLFVAYGPGRFERWLPGWAKRDSGLGVAVWEIIALPLALLLLIGLGFLIYRALLSMRSSAPYRWATGMLDAIAIPAALIVTGLVGWWLTRNLFVFSAPVDVFMSPVWTTLIVAAIFVLLIRLFDRLLDNVIGDRIEDINAPENEGDRELRTNLSAARRIILVIAFVAGAGLILMQTNLFGGAAVALLGSAGLLTLVFGFAARSALSSIMSSLQIAMSKSAKIGDDVLFEGHWATVERINFTFIQLKTWDRRRLIVPVDYFVSNPFENWTKKDATLTKVVDVRLNHFTDVDALRTHFQQFVEDDPGIITKNDAKVQVVDQDASGMLVRFYADAEDPSTGWDMHCRLREAMLKKAAELEPKRGDEPIFIPAEREMKIGDLS